MDGQTSQQVPTTGGGEVDKELQITPERISALQAATGPQEHLQMPSVDPKMKHIGATVAMLGGALNTFVPFLGTAVMMHSKQQKEHQINEAVNEFMALDGIWDAAYQRASMEAKGDQEKTKQLAQKYAQEDPRLTALFQGPQGKKRIKNFAKVFQLPWLNDGKTTVHSEALQRFMQLKPASKMMEMSAGLMQAAQGAAGVQGGAQGQPGPKQAQGGQPGATGGQPGGQSQPQQQPQQGGGQPPQGAELLQGLPHRVSPADPKALTPYSEYLRAIDAVRNRYDFKTDNEGRAVAFDKRNGTAKELRVMSADGTDRPFIGTVRGMNGKVASVDNVPIGVYGVTPDGMQGVKHRGDANWTGADEKTFSAAEAAWAKGEAMKDKRIRLSADARAKAWAQTRLYDAYDAQSNSMVKINALDNIANPGRYAPTGPAMTIQNRIALFNEIEKSGIRYAKEAIAGMGDEPFPANVKEALVVMLRQDDPRSYWENFLKTTVADNLNDAQMNYVTALISLDESALSLRSLGGLGQGSDQLRSAIVAMLPGPGTPSAKYANRQMSLFEAEVKQLKSTLPKLGNLKDDQKPQKKKMDF